MKKRKPYKFTKKQFSPWSVMSTILGLVSLCSMILAVIFTFQNQGEARVGYGLTSIFALIFSGIGMTLAIKTKMEPDMFYLFSVLGIVLNGLVLLFLIYILGLGIMYM